LPVPRKPQKRPRKVIDLTSEDPLPVAKKRPRNVRNVASPNNQPQKPRRVLEVAGQLKPALRAPASLLGLSREADFTADEIEQIAAMLRDDEIQAKRKAPLSKHPQSGQPQGSQPQPAIDIIYALDNAIFARRRRG
jgi:hypothetical protein